MSETDRPHDRTVQVDEFTDVTRHMGAESCEYPDCTNPADYDVTAKRNSQEATIAACHGCAVENGVRPGDYDL